MQLTVKMYKDDLLMGEIVDDLDLWMGLVKRAVEQEFKPPAPAPPTQTLTPKPVARRNWISDMTKALAKGQVDLTKIPQVSRRDAARALDKLVAQGYARLVVKGVYEMKPPPIPPEVVDRQPLQKRIIVDGTTTAAQIIDTCEDLNG